MDNDAVTLPWTGRERLLVVAAGTCGVLWAVCFVAFVNGVEWVIAGVGGLIPLGVTFVERARRLRRHRHTVFAAADEP